MKQYILNKNDISLLKNIVSAMESYIIQSKKFTYAVTQKGTTFQEFYLQYLNEIKSLIVRGCMSDVINITIDNESHTFSLNKHIYEEFKNPHMIEFLDDIHIDLEEFHDELLTDLHRLIGRVTTTEKHQESEIPFDKQPIVISDDEKDKMSEDRSIHGEMPILKNNSDDQEKNLWNILKEVISSMNQEGFIKYYNIFKKMQLALKEIENKTVSLERMRSACEMWNEDYFKENKELLKAVVLSLKLDLQSVSDSEEDLPLKPQKSRTKIKLKKQYNSNEIPEDKVYLSDDGIDEDIPTPWKESINNASKKPRDFSDDEDFTGFIRKKQCNEKSFYSKR